MQQAVMWYTGLEFHCTKGASEFKSLWPCLYNACNWSHLSPYWQEINCKTGRQCHDLITHALQLQLDSKGVCIPFPRTRQRCTNACVSCTTVHHPKLQHWARQNRTFIHIKSTGKPVETPSPSYRHRILLALLQHVLKRLALQMCGSCFLEAIYFCTTQLATVCLSKNASS